jgi:hypothetical protein
MRVRVKRAFQLTCMGLTQAQVGQLLGKSQQAISDLVKRHPSYKPRGRGRPPGRSGRLPTVSLIESFI